MHHLYLLPATFSVSSRHDKKATSMKTLRLNLKHLLTGVCQRCSVLKEVCSMQTVGARKQKVR